MGHCYPDYPDCTTDCERMPECTVCHRSKAPRGRDTPTACSYCGPDCTGYLDAPMPGHLWPGELARLRETEADE